jgi:hypothetical protein
LTTALTEVRLDGGTQARVTLDEDAIAEYAEAYRQGHDMPPIVVFDDGGSLWLADGFHRYYGALRAQRATLKMDVREGTQRDAIIFAAAANHAHGLRRTNADKRRAVEMLLADAKCSQFADRVLGVMAHVDHKTVAAVRLGNSPTKVSTGTPTPVQSPTGNQQEGDEGAGVELATDGYGLPPPVVTGTPAPNEPCIDLLGVTAGSEWLDVVRITQGIVDGIDRQLRQLQAAARVLPAPHAAYVIKALHDAAVVTRAHRPEVLCPMCKHNGTACLSCGGNGWMSAEAKKGLHPSMLEPKAEKPKAPRVKVVLETADGDVPFDDVPDATDEDYSA